MFKPNNNYQNQGQHFYQPSPPQQAHYQSQPYYPQQYNNSYQPTPQPNIQYIPNQPQHRSAACLACEVCCCATDECCEICFC
ncbi:hypothetical protein BJ944DRAFT_242507 [Cunninghamella echinulata]|nr:hypothetical protein BJ944DRAFT_242507 [Cunninghamella echinulata]